MGTWEWGASDAGYDTRGAVTVWSVPSCFFFIFKSDVGYANLGFIKYMDRHVYMRGYTGTL